MTAFAARSRPAAARVLVRTRSGLVVRRRWLLRRLSDSYGRLQATANRAASKHLDVSGNRQSTAARALVIAPGGRQPGDAHLGQ